MRATRLQTHLNRPRLLWALGVLLLSCLLAISDASADTVLRVGMYQNPPEVSYTDAEHPEGISVDILAAIASAEGWTLRYVPGTFQEGVSRLQSGEIDLMVSVARTEQRAALLQFPAEPVVHSWSEVYAGRAAKIQKLADLSSRRVAVVGGSIQHELFRNLAADFGVNPTLVLADDFPDSIAAVVDGKADAVITNPFNGRWLAGPAGLRDTAIMFGPMDIFYAGSPQLDPTVLGAIDMRLRQMKNDPKSPYFEALQRWTRPEEFEVPDWLKWAIALGLVVLAMSAAWAFSLHRYARKLAASEAKQRHHSEELEEANRELQAFSSAVSHDLRTPLAAISSLLDAMLRNQHAGLSPDCRQYAERSVQAATEMRELIQALLSLSRLGKQPLRRENVDMSQLATELAAELQLAEPGRDTRFEIEPGLVAQADRGLARQVLANLMSNAWKFTARAPAGRIDVGRTEDEGGRRFFVRDNGVGFDAAGAERLFEPFQRFHKASEFSGTGIGLATVRRIVRRHGGAIWADSSPGDGATFHFTLEPAK